MASARTELGDFLRSRRAQLDPRELGLNSLRRRRTPGLRREEVAELAGIGTDWYTRLEQGRAVRPSVSTIDAIARAMRLTGAECDHLRRLVRLDQRTAFAPEVVPSTLVRLVESMPFPAYVTGSGGTSSRGTRRQRTCSLILPGRRRPNATSSSIC